MSFLLNEALDGKNFEGWRRRVKGEGDEHGPGNGETLLEEDGEKAMRKGSEGGGKKRGRTELDASRVQGPRSSVIPTTWTARLNSAERKEE